MSPAHDAKNPLLVNWNNPGEKVTRVHIREESERLLETEEVPSCESIESFLHQQHAILQ